MEPAPMHPTSRTTADDGRATPAGQWLNPFFIAAFVGVVLVVLANVVWTFAALEDAPGDLIAPLLFQTFGGAALAVGLALGGTWMTSVGAGPRVAMFLGGAYFATSTGLFGMFAATFGGLL